jgi:hypothetical protein
MADGCGHSGDEQCYDAWPSSLRRVIIGWGMVFHQCPLSLGKASASGSRDLTARFTTVLDAMAPSGEGVTVDATLRCFH